VVIRVLDQNYFVLQTLPSETGLTQYVCKNVSADDGLVYRIVQIPMEETTPELLAWLSQLFRAGRFRELVQYASERDRLQVVVDCGPEEAAQMEQILVQEKPSLKERFRMGGKLLERLIISDIPACFAIPALDALHVRYTPALECSLSFELDQLPAFFAADQDKFWSRLRRVLRRLFTEELRDRKLPELKAYLDRLLEQDFSDMLEAYKAWLPIAEQYSEAEEEKLEAKSLPYVIWDKIKAFWHFLKSLFFLVVLGIALFYLINSVRTFLAPTEQKDVYEMVGDLPIISGTAGQAGPEQETAMNTETEARNE